MVRRSDQQIIVRAGSNSKNGLETVRVNMRKVLLHPVYEEPWLLTKNRSDIRNNSTKLLFDLALVKLETKFTQHLNDGKNYRINTVCLPKARRLNQDYEDVSFTGFGKISDGTFVDELQAADFRLMPYQECNRHKQFSLCAQTLYRLNEAKICAVSLPAIEMFELACTY